MCEQVPRVKASVQIAGSGVHKNADEYVIPTSSIFPLEEERLADMSDNALWIAKNEIYARHGRQFTNEFLQQYFNRCTWYEGIIPPEEFQDSVLSELEKDNIKLLAAATQEYEKRHPYPKKYRPQKLP